MHSRVLYSTILGADRYEVKDIRKSIFKFKIALLAKERHVLGSCRDITRFSGLVSELIDHAAWP